MSALPSSTTARVKIIYQNAVNIHDTVIRMTDDSFLSDLSAAFVAYTTTLSGQFVDTTVIDVQLASVGSDLFFPVAGATLLGYNWGGASANVAQDTQFAQLSGRSAGGRKSKFYLFGYSGSLSNYRLNSSEDASVGTAVTALNALSDVFLAIDGLATVWKPYLNIKANDHWVHRAR